jgi:O-antigen/teichoic acid export membrane protein
VKKVLNHTFFMALSTALRLLTGVVIFVVMARIWGPDKFGSFMYLFTTTSLIALIVDYGFSQQLMRDIGFDKTNIRELITGVMSAKLMLTSGIILVFGIVSITPWGQQQPLSVFWILLMTCIVSSFADTFNAVFRGLGHYKAETNITFCVNLVHFGFVFGLLVAGQGVIEVALGFLVSRILFFYLTLRTYECLVPPTECIKNTKIVNGLKNLRNGFPFAAEAAFTNFQSQADTLIVHHFLGAGAVGVYQAGLRLMQGANTFAQVLSNVYLPAMANKISDKVGLKLLSNRLFLQMLLVGSGFMLVFVLGAQVITHTLYGNRYDDLIALMPWFGVLLLLRYVAASHGVTLSAVGLQSTRVAAIFIALVALFTATYFLIPSLGLLGMLYASILAVACLYFVYAITLALRGFPMGITTLNIATLVAVVGVATFFIAG